MKLMVLKPEGSSYQMYDAICEKIVSVGFDDPLYFSRVFRRATGLSPTEYRTKKVDS